MRKLIRIFLFVLFSAFIILGGFWLIWYFKIPVQISGFMGIIQGIILVVVFVEYVYDYR